MKRMLCCCFGGDSSATNNGGGEKSWSKHTSPKDEIDTDEFMESSQALYYTNQQKHGESFHHSEDEEKSIELISQIRMNQNVKEYSTEEYKTLWKQFGDMHVTLEYSVLDKSAENDQIKSDLDNLLESFHIYTLASGVNVNSITFYNYCESTNNITYLIETTINETRTAKVRIKYSSNEGLNNFVNYFENCTKGFLKRTK
ncbi:predicted protein [Naegleria gruberi]|uniref:Predicted protein n=1 Tax=Naegleria gruberi TaxID=5762 RepID=D2VXG3_NAEGR|nr:uncharacterized protein NAEGRDRAFT_73737 [Naegleria gruberi]EFC38502.1 predicted protein [Naegleria gruberi]|eukprot:XP_002671246.1 predicted protein [Naegleria gruberi strain NEG-M]